MAAMTAVFSLVACSPQDVERLRGKGAASDAVPAVSSSSTLQSSALHAGVAMPGNVASVDQKASIHAAYLSARMKEAASDARYAVTTSNGGALVARGVEDGLDGHFDERGVALSSDATDTKGRLDVVAFGCGEKVEAVTSSAPVRDAKKTNRLSYVRHAGKETFTESWTNGAPGMEQEFTVERSPCAHGVGADLKIELAVGGLTPSMRDGKTEGAAVELRDEDGAVRVRYADLYAYDAAGTALPARMVLDGGRVALRVSVEDATWPVVVDPIVATLEAELSINDGAANDNFGTSVAVSGSTALIGVPGKTVGVNPGQGAVYVFGSSGTSWILQTRLTASDGTAHADFGVSVALNGNAALAGADGDDGAKGAAYVFALNGTNWTQQAKLTASDAASGDYLGTSVAVDGSTVLVGSEGTGISQGAAYVFVQSGTGWTQQVELTAGGGSFVRSVALNGNTALVGTPYHSPGSAYVFARNGTSWTQQAELTASDGVTADRFGWSVALGGSEALVGADTQTVGANTQQGEAYVFAQSGTKWTEQAKLNGADGDGLFGSSVALSGNTALVGAFGQAAEYVFTQSGTSWAQQAMLTDGAAEVDYFGLCGALSGSTVVVGAYDKEIPLQGDALDTNAGEGAAYVFVQAGTSWTQQAELTEFTTTKTAGAFSEVALSGNSALVGGGNAYVFTQSNTTWSLPAKLTASDGSALGGAVALSGNTALTLAPFCDTPAADCAPAVAYVSVQSGTSWTQQAELTVNGATIYNFGGPVALSRNTALIGGPTLLGSNNPYSGPGAAYVFVRSGTTWAEQTKLTGDSTATFNFARSVALSGNTALVGDDAQAAVYVFVQNGTSWTQQAKLAAGGNAVALGDNVALIGGEVGSTTQGAAYVFVRTGTTWAEQAELTASDGAANDGFGSSVALSGSANEALIGAYNANAQKGAAYVFAQSGTSWTQQSELTASDGVVNDAFGGSVALNANTALVTGGDVAYAFDLTGLAGSTCGVNSDCATNYSCVDGVCCTSACTGPCGVCSAALGATADGTCTPVRAGTAGSPVCQNNSFCDGVSTDCPSGCAADSDCAANTFCTQAGTCAPVEVIGEGCNLTACKDPTNCRVCSASTCADNVCCATACDQPCATCRAGSGLCGPVAQGTLGTPNCAGYVCDGQNVTCPTSCTLPTDCATGYGCVNGVCTGVQNLAAACTADAECASGHCADGVCCNDVCDGECAWCADPSNPGTCEPTPAGQAPKGTRVACSGSGACFGQCDGATLAACVYPGNATQCAPATCVNDSILTASTCDTAGGCAAGTLQPCGSYTCDPNAGACKTVCTTKSDCRLGAVCDTTSGTGVCNAAGATCPDAYSVKASDGTTSSCNGYQCVSGACQQQCGTSADCAPGYDCAGSSCVVGAVSDAGVGGTSSAGGAASTGGAATSAGAATSSGGSIGASAGGASATNTGGTPTTGADAGAQTQTGTGGKPGAATSKDAGGCGCRVSNGADSRGSYAAVFGVLALVGLRRRVRPRPRARRVSARRSGK